MFRPFVYIRFKDSPFSAKEHLEKYKIQDRDDVELAIDNNGLYESKLYGN